jgi:hypothetical protein
MTYKTLKDCMTCPYLINCDAHVSGGTHRHEDEPDPCELDLKSSSKSE